MPDWGRSKDKLETATSFCTREASDKVLAMEYFTGSDGEAIRGSKVNDFKVRRTTIAISQCAVECDAHFPLINGCVGLRFLPKQQTSVGRSS